MEPTFLLLNPLLQTLNGAFWPRDIHRDGACKASDEELPDRRGHAVSTVLPCLTGTAVLVLSVPTSAAVSILLALVKSKISDPSA